MSQSANQASMMSCPSCKATVSKQAAACPKCGHQFKAPGGINLKDPVHLIGIAIAIMFLLGAISTMLR